jgi:hypothetical protein
MTLYVNGVEAVWLAVNAFTFFLTVGALVDARADQVAIRLLNGAARELAASSSVRRELIRLVVQLGLLGIAVPSLFVPGEASLNYFVAVLMAIAILLCVQSIFDTRDRKAMTVLVAAEMLIERATAFTRLERQNRELATALAENTAQGAVTETTVEDTATKVGDIHDATVKNGGGAEPDH